MDNSPLLIGDDAPHGWKRCRLGDIADIYGGTTPRRSEPTYWGGSIPWARPSDLTALAPGVLEIDSTEDQLTETAINETSVRIMSAGSVLMTSRATIGEVAINNVPMATNQGFCNFVPGKELYAPFLAYWLLGNTRRLKRLATGSTFKELSRKDARKIEIALPPLDEQRRIAKKLSSVDTAIRASGEALEQAKKVREGLLIELFGSRPESSPLG